MCTLGKVGKVCHEEKICCMLVHIPIYTLVLEYWQGTKVPGADKVPCTENVRGGFPGKGKLDCKLPLYIKLLKNLSP